MYDGPILADGTPDKKCRAWKAFREEFDPTSVFVVELAHEELTNMPVKEFLCHLVLTDVNSGLPYRWKRNSSIMQDLCKMMARQWFVYAIDLQPVTLDMWLLLNVSPVMATAIVRCVTGFAGRRRCFIIPEGMIFSLNNATVRLFVLGW